MYALYTMCALYTMTSQHPCSYLELCPGGGGEVLAVLVYGLHAALWRPGGQQTVAGAHREALTALHSGQGSFSIGKGTRGYMEAVS